LPPALDVVIAAPADSLADPATEELLEATRRQLRRAFGLFGGERGWPLPSFCLRGEAAPVTTEWSYRIALPGGPGVAGSLRPNQLLALGDERALAGMLGIETLEPFTGQPAKWVGRSQLPLAQAANAQLFDGPALVAAHCLHLLDGRLWHRCLGLPQLQPWLLSAAGSHAGILKEIMEKHAGLLLRTVRELVADDLWLPPSATLLEHFASALAELPPPVDPELLVELLRKEIVPLNLHRFLASDGILHAVEWRADPEGELSEPTRLARLSQAIHAAWSRPDWGTGMLSLLTDLEIRAEFGRLMRPLFPCCPVLSWAEIPSHTRLNVIAVVDGQLETDPSPWPQAIFEISAGSGESVS
jgi:flagellar biosynthesis component FlhA